MSHLSPLRCAVVLVLAAAGSALAQITETPFTVKPGHFLLRLDAFTLQFNRDVSSGYSGLAAGRTLLTTGLTSDLDLQVGVDAFVSRRFTSSGDTIERDSGFGDMYVRSKWTFWREDSVGAAAALLPYVRFPTSSGGVSSKSADGGLIIPVSWDLLGGWQGGAMAQWALVRNDADNGYDSLWFASIAARHHIVGTLEIYGEATTSANSAGLDRWTGSIGGGATMQITAGFQVDYALQRGLNSETDTWSQRLRLNWNF